MMFVHYFQIITNFLCVCQSVSWLTSLLKLGPYRDISFSWWYIFRRIFGHIPEMFVHFFWTLTIFLYVCQSISWLTNLLKFGPYRDISCSGWDIFQIFLGDIPEMFLHYFQIVTNFLYVCQSISWLTFSLKLGYYRDISSSWCDIFLKSFGNIPWMFVHQFKINLNSMYCCQSVGWLTFLMKSDKYKHISSSKWNTFIYVISVRN